MTRLETIKHIAWKVGWDVSNHPLKYEIYPIAQSYQCFLMGAEWADNFP